jgi:hypothetical protein
MGMQLASCGLLEFDVDDIENEEVQDKISMLLNYDTVYALPGDTFALNPVYVDDKGQLQELNISGLLITSSNSEVVEVDYVKKTIKAVGVGECKVYVEPVAVLNNIINKKDSLMVYVFDLWEPTSRVFPYETVFYTKATVDGKELDTNDMSLFAFVPLPNFYSNNPFIGFECRAKGVPMNYHNKKGVMQLRVGADELGSEDDDDWDVEYEYEYETDEEGNLVLDGDGFPIIKRDENGKPIIKRDENGDPIKAEAEDAIGVGNNSIIFRLYDKRTHQLYTCAKQVISDGETKGSLSKPYQLDFESYAYQQKKK